MTVARVGSSLSGATASLVTSKPRGTFPGWACEEIQDSQSAGTRPRRTALLPEQEAEIRGLFASFDPGEFVTPYAIKMASIVLTDMVPDTYAISDLTVRIVPDHPDDIDSVCGGEFAIQNDRSLVWQSTHVRPQTLRIFFIARDPAYRDR